jgi:carbon dioxide concentrating mechanism protein CcmO
MTNDSLGLLETIGLTPTLWAIDVMEKSGDVRLAQCELNDLGGVATKILGPTAAVETALARGRAAAEQLGGQPVATVIHHPDDRAWQAIESPPQYNPLIEQDVVFFPNYQSADRAAEESPMSSGESLALGIIETQGFTAVFEAIDTACKAGNVQVIGKEKLGGGYVAVIIQGDLAAVTAAVEAGKEKVDGLGKLIAAHVLARPSSSVLALLPKA